MLYIIIIIIIIKRQIKKISILSNGPNTAPKEMWIVTLISTFLIPPKHTSKT